MQTMNYVKIGALQHFNVEVLLSYERQMPSVSGDLSLLLSSTALFRNLAQLERERVVAAAQFKDYRRDAFLFFQDDPANTFYLLLEGQIKLTQLTPEGQQVIHHIVTPGEVFAVVAVLSEAPFPVTAQAIEDCKLLGWTQTAIQGLMGRYPSLSINAIRILARHICEFQDRFREIATERVERRIARALLRLANQSGVKTSEGVRIDFPLTRQDLADMTGTTLYTASRTLSQWERQGIVKSKREQVIIRQPHRLVVIAEEL